MIDELVDVLAMLGALLLGSVPVWAYLTGHLAFGDVVVIQVGFVVTALVLIHSEVSRS